MTAKWRSLLIFVDWKLNKGWKKVGLVEIKMGLNNKKLFEITNYEQIIAHKYSKLKQFYEHSKLQLFATLGSENAAVFGFGMKNFIFCLCCIHLFI